MDCEGHPLSVEAVNLVVFLAVEAFVREILPGAIKYHFNWLFFLKHAKALTIINEVIVGSIEVVEKCDKDGVVINKAANDIGIWEIVIAHRVVI